MAHDESKRREVRGNYVYKGLNLKAACAAADIPYETGRSWKRNAAMMGDDWDNAKAAHQMSAGGAKNLTAMVLEDFSNLFVQTMEELKTAENIPAATKAEMLSRLSDAYSKTVKAAGCTNPELSRLSISMDVLKRLMEFITSEYPDMRKPFIEVLEPFGEMLSREFG